MKASLLNKVSCGLLLILLLLTSYGCKKDANDKFCEKKRTTKEEVIDRAGVVIYSDRYQRYTIGLAVNIPGNIDTQITGFPCSLPTDLQKPGLKVITSGTLKFFNDNENMLPSTGGEELYFFETTKVVKQQ